MNGLALMKGLHVVHLVERNSPRKNHQAEHDRKSDTAHDKGHKYHNFSHNDPPLVIMRFRSIRLNGSIISIGLS